MLRDRRQTVARLVGPDVEGNETGASGTRPRIPGSSATADSGAEGGMAERSGSTGPGILVLERGGEEGVRAVANLTGRAISLAGLELGGGDLLLSTEDERYGGTLAATTIPAMKVSPRIADLWQQGPVMSDVSVLGHRIAEAVARTVGERFCHPTATYRVQFEKDKMGFRSGRRYRAVFDELGISHLYASPYLKIRSGSTTNGYAIVDYSQLNPDLGSETDYRAMVEALHGRGMGQILDTVPNHMSATPMENPWWTDVLENGPGSPHAAYFDIDWRPVKEELQNRILLPILGDQYGQVLEAGELKLEYREGAFFVRYYRSLLPLEPRTYRAVLAIGWTPARALPADSEDFGELESIVTALEHLPELHGNRPGAASPNGSAKRRSSRAGCAR